MLLAAEGCRRKFRPCRAMMRGEEDMSSSALKVCRQNKKGKGKRALVLLYRECGAKNEWLWRLRRCMELKLSAVVSEAK